MRHGYLIDMDGVLCRGSQSIPGADRFVAALRDAELPFLVLTNNSQRTRRDIATKLQRLGIPVLEEHIFTSAIATARFLARMKPNGTAYVIGEGGLTTALHMNGFAIVDHAPDFVVVGEGRTVSYEQLEQAVSFIVAGARLIATNLDPSCPTEFGLRPGCGALVAMLEAATGRKAFSVGKPSPVMLRAARKELNLRTDETCIIGDSMDTDILGGVQLGFHTVLVLSGSTRREELNQYPFGADVVVESVADLVEALQESPQTPIWDNPSVRSNSANSPGDAGQQRRPGLSAVTQGAWA